MSKNNLRPQDICQYLGLSSIQAVYNWYEARSLPSTENLWLLSILVGVPMNDFISGDFYGHD